MQEHARAKINLSLRVLGRRPDNFHELESLVTFAETGDVLSVSEGEGLHLSVSGPFAHQLVGDGDNLVIQAARALQNFAGVMKGAHIKLEKNLPIASGIGGGSADAAATLRLLKKFWDIELADKDGSALALMLGADVPVCLLARPMMMRGIGERLLPLRLPHFWMLLVNPGVGVSTADIFRRLAAAPLERTTRDDTAPHFANFDTLLDWLRENPNDLEKPATDLNPVIGRAIELLGHTQHCRLARMSGSGATCFGLFEREGDARAAARELQQTHPDWWLAVSVCG